MEGELLAGNGWSATPTAGEAAQDQSSVLVHELSDWIEVDDDDFARAVSAMI